jgi:hypothetical protein
MGWGETNDALKQKSRDFETCFVYYENCFGGNRSTWRYQHVQYSADFLHEYFSGCSVTIEPERPSVLDVLKWKSGIMRMTSCGRATSRDEIHASSAGPSLDTVQCNLYRSVAVISCWAMHERNFFLFSSPPFESDWGRGKWNVVALPDSLLKRETGMPLTRKSTSNFISKTQDRHRRTVY